MAQSTSAELNPLIHGLELMIDETNPTGAELSRHVEIDGSSGHIGINLEVLEKAANTSMPAAVADLFLSATRDMLAGGLAIFQNHTEREPLRSVPGKPSPLLREKAEKLAVPWVVIRDLVHGSQGRPPALRRALGLADGASGGEVSQLLRKSFPHAPEWLLINGAAAPHLQDLGVALKEKRANDPSAEAAAFPLLPSSVLEPTSALDDYIAVANGLIHGAWNGLGGSWWGWPFGWQVAISGGVANTLANLLIGFDGGWKLCSAHEK
jgi:hypothetical protein